MKLVAADNESGHFPSPVLIILLSVSVSPVCQFVHNSLSSWTFSMWPSKKLKKMQEVSVRLHQKREAAQHQAVQEASDVSASPAPDKCGNKQSSSVVSKYQSEIYCMHFYVKVLKY